MLLISPEVAGKPRCALVDAAIALDKLIHWFGIRLIFQGVPQGTGPFRAGSFVDFRWIACAPNDRGEGLGAGGAGCTTLDPQSPPRPFGRPAVCRPPGNQIKHRAQVRINSIPFSAALTFVPGFLDPE